MMDTNNAATINDSPATSDTVDGKLPMPPPTRADALPVPAIEALISEYHKLVDQIHPNKQAANKKKVVTFPVKLYFILKLAPKYDLDHIISWQVHGRNFVIRNRNLFLQQIASRIFESTKFSSFQRQLNVYDFQIVTSKHKTDKGAYYHSQFVRGRFDLCQTMVRVRIGGERRRSSTSSSQSASPAVPNFYGLPYCYDSDDGPKETATSNSTTTTQVNTATNVHEPQVVHNTETQSSGNYGHTLAANIHESLQQHYGYSLQQQFYPWGVFDKFESKPTNHRVHDMNPPGGSLNQKVSLIQALTRAQHSFAEAASVVSHDGMVCGYSTAAGNMRLHPAPCEVDWHDIYTEAMSINMDFKDDVRDVPVSWPIVASTGDTMGNRKEITLEKLLEAAEEEIQTIFEDDDFYGLQFHFVDDEIDECVSVASSQCFDTFDA